MSGVLEITSPPKNKLAQTEAARAAAEAPDKAKLLAFAAIVRGLEFPQLNNIKVAALLAAQQEKFAAWIDTQATNL